MVYTRDRRRQVRNGKILTTSTNLLPACVHFFISRVKFLPGTLADRLLEVTGTVALRDMKEQFMDSNEIERDRGITMYASVSN